MIAQAKGGEDLRLDFRLQQLFGVMNERLRRDPLANSRQLNVRTFGVIPTAKLAGMLNWVDNTRTFQDVFGVHAVSSQTENPGKQAFFSQLKDWKLQPDNVHKVYHDLFKRDDGEIAKMFEDVSATCPPGHLARHVRKLVTSAEAYLAIRKNFATSLAVFNMASLFPYPISQCKPSFARRVSGINHFVCFASAYYTRFSRITRNKARVESFHTLIAQARTYARMSSGLA